MEKVQVQGLYGASGIQDLEDHRNLFFRDNIRRLLQLSGNTGGRGGGLFGAFKRLPLAHAVFFIDLYAGPDPIGDIFKSEKQKPLAAGQGSAVGCEPVPLSVFQLIRGDRNLPDGLIHGEVK